jgi:hypothetical protein
MTRKAVIRQAAAPKADVVALGEMLFGGPALPAARTASGPGGG